MRLAPVVRLPSSAERLAPARAIARCAYDGVLVHACTGRLRVRAISRAAFDSWRDVLRPREREMVAYLSEHPPPVILDFETLSAGNLGALGGRRYADHPTTEVLCMVALLPDGELVEWNAREEKPERVFAVARAVGIVAHNGEAFDRPVWEATLGWPRLDDWRDSLLIARIAGYPGKLAEIARRLPGAGAGKDDEGSALVAALSRRYASHGERPEVSAAVLARIIDYCRSDVLVLARIYRGLLADAEALEPEVRRVDATIQRRGFGLDHALARAALDVHGAISHDFAVDVPSSVALLTRPQQLVAWLTSRGVEVHDAKAETLASVLARPNLPPDVRRTIEARLFRSAIGAGKLRTALDDVDADGRLRYSLRYAGTHTGRWSGVGLQPHNLPRGLDSDTTARAVDLALARDAAGLMALARAKGLRPEDVIGTLVRPCIVAPAGSTLGIVDYAQIEARVLAWLAGDTDALGEYRAGVDRYARMAEMLYGLAEGTVRKGDPRRTLGKLAVLGLGYSMGGKRFRVQAAKEGIDWSTVPLTPEEIVERWRDASPNIAGERVEGSGRRGGLWLALNGAARRVVRDRGAVTVGRLTWRMQGSDLLCVLPSGRYLRYAEARVERADGRAYESVTFRTRRDRRAGYGGLWTENAVQAIARDLLAASLVRIETAGLPVVLHVHDEIVCELPSKDDLGRMMDLCRLLPPWAEGLPLEVDGHAAPRYHKA